MRAKGRRSGLAERSRAWLPLHNSVHNALSACVSLLFVRAPLPAASVVPRTLPQDTVRGSPALQPRYDTGHKGLMPGVIESGVTDHVTVAAWIPTRTPSGDRYVIRDPLQPLRRVHVAQKPRNHSFPWRRLNRDTCSPYAPPPSHVYHPPTRVPVRHVSPLVAGNRQGSPRGEWSPQTGRYAPRLVTC